MASITIRRLSDETKRRLRIAATRRATLATRNVDDFHGCGLELINPWPSS